MKKGFVFLETLLVVVVVTVSVLTIYSAYVKVTSNIDARANYDSIGDLYKTDIIRDYVISNWFWDVTTNYVKLNQSNCTTYMSSECSGIFPFYGAENVYLVQYSTQSLLDENSDELPNSLKQYLKTISSEGSTIIIQYRRNNKNYYSSLKLWRGAH